MQTIPRGGFKFGSLDRYTAEGSQKYLTAPPLSVCTVFTIQTISFKFLSVYGLISKDPYGPCMWCGRNQKSGIDITEVFFTKDQRLCCCATWNLSKVGALWSYEPNSPLEIILCWQNCKGQKQRLVLQSMHRIYKRSWPSVDDSRLKPGSMICKRDILFKSLVSCLNYIFAVRISRTSHVYT